MAEWLYLILQKASNGVDRVATLKFDGERMMCQRDACGFLICLQGRLEKGLKSSGFRVVSHITNRKEMESLGGGFVSCEEMTVRGEGGY